MFNNPCRVQSHQGMNQTGQTSEVKHNHIHVANLSSLGLELQNHRLSNFTEPNIRSKSALFVKGTEELPPTPTKRWFMG